MNISTFGGFVLKRFPLPFIHAYLLKLDLSLMSSHSEKLQYLSKLRGKAGKAKRIVPWGENECTGLCFPYH